MARKNTKLEAEGAEFLVLGNLLARRIEAYKTYTNMPGYDLIAVSPEPGCSARLQVKSRLTSKDWHFMIHQFDCDFVIFVRLNSIKSACKGSELNPEFFVLPRDLVEKKAKAHRDGKMQYVMTNKDIPKYEGYRDNWYLISSFLAKKYRKNRTC